MTYQISGELAADEFSEDVLKMNAVSGEATFSSPMREYKNKPNIDKIFSGGNINGKILF